MAVNQEQEVLAKRISTPFLFQGFELGKLRSDCDLPGKLLFELLEALRVDCVEV